MTRRIDKSVSQLTEPVKAEVIPLPPPAGTPEGILQQAIAHGASPEVVRQYYEFYREMQRDKAVRAFNAAYAKFRQICPPVPRRTVNGQFKRAIIDRDGVRRDVPRMYASLEDIGATVKVPLAQCGLSYAFGDMVVKDGHLTITCILSHEDGHSESSAAVMPIESKAGCSEQQKYGAAETYARRSALKNRLGIVEADEDDDAMPAEKPNSDERITEHEAANLEGAIDSIGADRAKFLAWLGVQRFADIPKSRLAEAFAAIDRRRKAT